MSSLKGKLLLASGRLVDPNFLRTVILIVQHDENGAMGLVLNRPLQTTVKEVCAEAMNLQCGDDSPLYHGGPCEGPMMVLHTVASASQMKATGDIFFTTDRAEIESVLLHADATLKCFVGYAGWAAGQIENEMAVGSWLPVEADKDEIFSDTAREEQWSRLMQRTLLSQWIDPEKIPENPNLN